MNSCRQRFSVAVGSLLSVSTSKDVWCSKKQQPQIYLTQKLIFTFLWRKPGEFTGRLTALSESETLFFEKECEGLQGCWILQSLNWQFVAHLSSFLGCLFQDTRVGHDFYIHWPLEDDKIALGEERYFCFCAIVKSSKCLFIAEQEKTE